MIPTESAPSNDTAAASRVVAHVQGVCGHPVDTQGYSGARSSDASCFSYAEFTPVKHRKHRKNNKRTALNERLSTTPSQHLRRARQNLLDDGHDWLSKASHILSGALQAMSLNHCSGGSEDHDGKLDSVLCLGLGSPSSSQNANAQLAFLLEIAKALNIPTNRIAVYDPVFTEVDQQLFAELGVGSLCENKAGRYELLVPTLCFMPHCDKELYDSILQANWTPDRLRNFILVGNRLAEYIDNNPSDKLRRMVPYLFSVARVLECHPLSPSKIWPTAFNNTCVQYLLPSSIDKLKLSAETPRLRMEERPIQQEKEGGQEDVLAAAVSSLSITVESAGAVSDTQEAEKE